jgi:hypothetical protein
LESYFFNKRLQVLDFFIVNVNRYFHLAW